MIKPVLKSLVVSKIYCSLKLPGIVKTKLMSKTKYTHNLRRHAIKNQHIPEFLNILKTVKLTLSDKQTDI